LDVNAGALGVDLGLDEPTAAELQQAEIESNSNSSSTPVKDVGDADVADSSPGAGLNAVRAKKMFPAQGTLIS